MEPRARATSAVAGNAYSTRAYSIIHTLRLRAHRRRRRGQCTRRETDAAVPLRRHTHDDAMSLLLLYDFGGGGGGYCNGLGSYAENGTAAAVI